MGFGWQETGVQNLEFSLYGTDYLENILFLDRLAEVMKTYNKPLTKKVHVVVYQDRHRFRLAQEDLDTVYFYIDIKSSRIQKIVESTFVLDNPKRLFIVENMKEKIKLYKTLVELPYKLPYVTNLKLEDTLFLELHRALSRASLKDFTRDLLTLNDIYLPDYIYGLVETPTEPEHPIDRIFKNSKMYADSKDVAVNRIKVLIQSVLENNNSNKHTVYKKFDNLDPEVTKYIKIFNQIVE
jgi:hypothetical protein